MDAHDYLDAIRTRLATSATVREAEVIREQVVGDRGFLRFRLHLTNGDFVDVAEYFVIQEGVPRPVQYRYHWMDSSAQRLRMRWDNAGHYPGLANFPHHVHIGHEGRVEPGRALSTLGLVDFLEAETSGAEDGT